MAATKLDIEQALKDAGVELDGVELAPLMDGFKPQLELWLKEYGTIPYPLVHAWVVGLAAGLKLRPLH